MKYRPEIDGLRAVAVLPVLFYHAGVPFFNGGYIGVDIFFVISGFLITKIIDDEIKGRGFSVVDFYERRARRIFPALFAVLIVSLAAASIFFLPEDFRRFTKNFLATIFFISNVQFYRESGYFDSSAETNPLLHTWSLAVEEQFYIFFPLVLIFIARRTRSSPVAFLMPLALVSFFVSEWMIGKDQAFSFYMLPTRAWELLAGSLLALGVLPELRSKNSRAAISAIGMVLVLFAMFGYSSQTPFPGKAALLPVLGAVFMIYAGAHGFIAHVLSTRPFVFIGRISYSLYIWHWPIVVFSEYFLIEKLHGWYSVAAILASFLAAVVSWACIERPFRSRKVFGRRAIFTLSSAFLLLFLGVGSFGFFLRGWADRFSPEVIHLTEAAQDISPLRARCHYYGESLSAANTKMCVLGKPSPPSAAEFAVWGDSHGVELSYALGEMAAKHGSSLIQFSASACPPAIGVPVQRRSGCIDRNNAVLGFLKQSNVKTIFLIARYSAAAYETRQVMGGIANSANELRAAGKKVVLIYPFPDSEFDVPTSIARTLLHGNRPEDFALGKDRYLAENRYALAELDRLHQAGIARVVPTDVLCNASHCITSRDGKGFYFDDNHLTMAGARYIAPLFEAFFDATGRSSRVTNGGG
ncbi:acyltransferase family protein [Luteimonas salinilitoris]|uniref:Acyltransferase family protein n=1 Tax=Luteimonas salinilitoris TaxID=3237697 RepID=A0ABV4HRC8_9GAMM